MYAGRGRVGVLLGGLVAAGFAAAQGVEQGAAGGPALPPQRCISAAAEYHKVNAHILWAVLKVESNFVPTVVTRNTNGSRDYGMGGINSIHLPELDRHGVDAGDLKDPCVNTFVAAWLLSRQMARHGNTWFGVAAYHSATPYFNSRYQILLRNALVDAKVLAGVKEKVPALNAR